MSKATDIATATADFASAILASRPMEIDAIPDLIATIRGCLGIGPGGSTEDASIKPVPAIAINRSVRPAYLVCLEDGQRVVMLKRYLRSRYQLTPEAYRIKWGLPLDYPMVAPNYSARRTEIALDAGLGRKRPRKAVPSPSDIMAPATPVKRSRGRPRLKA